MNFGPFSSIPVSKKRRTNFPESHEVAGTFPLSKVCPVCFIDSLPGSSWNINVYNLTKLETLIAPAMQNVNASLLWFKMPKRLLFKYFKKWYSGGEDGEDNHQKPHFHITTLRNDIYTNCVDFSTQALQEFTDQFFGPGSLWNYIGLPSPIYYDNLSGTWKVLSLASWDDELPEGEDPDVDFVDLLPLMGYNYIYDCFFRDQTLNDSIFVDSEEQDFTIDKGFTFYDSVNETKFYFGPEDKEPSDIDEGDGFYTSGNNLYEGGEINWVDVLCLMHLFNRAWKKEYFTSALPTPQRGPEVKLPFTGTAEVDIPAQHATLGTMDGDLIDQVYAHLDGNHGSGTSTVQFVNPSETPQSNVYIRNNNGADVENFGGKLSSLQGTADLSNLSPITIIAMRNLFRLQAFLEKNNVSGGRYIESILAHWGERVPDFTVQRPQFIRATSLPVQISEVTATANSIGTSSIVGDQAGRARTQGNLGRVHIYTQEPSLIFGLYVVGAPPSYAGQGIPRIFQHVTRFDEPWPDFQHIGEQAIKTRELYYDFKNADNLAEDFGYQQRFSEYKYMPDRVVGDFQTSLSYWHMARMFDKLPRLNGDFVTQNLDPRIFAVQNGRPVTASFYFDIKAKLKLSKFSTPKIS